MKHILISFSGTGVVQVAGVIVGVIAARLLLPEGRGELAAILLWPGFLASLFLINLNQAVAYYGAARSGAAQRFAIMALLFAAPLAIIAMVVGYAVMPILMRDFDPMVIALGRLYLLYIPVQFVASIMLATLQGSRHFVGWNVIRVTQALGYLTFVLCFVAFGVAKVGGFTVASIAAVGMSAIVGVRFVARLRGPYSRRPLAGEPQQLLRYALGIHMAALAGICTQQSDRILVALFLPAEQLGVYAVAVAAASVILMVGATIEPISLVRTAQQTGTAARVHILGRYFRLTIALAGSATLLFIIIGQWLVVALYGSAFVLSAQILPALLVGALARTITGSLYSGLKAMARLDAIRTAEYLVLAVQVTALLVFLPRFGVQGAAWAIALSGIVGAIVAAIAVNRAANCSVLQLACPTRDDWRYIMNNLVKARVMLIGRPDI